VSVALLLLLSSACGPADDMPATVLEPMVAPAFETIESAPFSVPADWKFAAVEPVVTSRGGMVTTDASLATDVGVAVLEAGGNAVDAAVATAFALAVVYPVAGNVGGGGFIVLRTPAGGVASLDFREKAPMGASRDMYLDEFGEVTRDVVVGHLASGVPGAVAGLWAAHQRYGSFPWDQLLAPAIELATAGFIADADFADAAGDERLGQFEPSRRLFWPQGEPVVEGTTWANPDLAAALMRIALEGPDGFYRGETADLIVAEMERGGGLITHEDLQAYEALWREPVVFDYRGHEVISMPPPSSGGLTLALIANTLEGYDLRGFGWHSTDAIHVIAEAMRRAFADRNHYLGDPDFVPIPREQFLSEDYAAGLRASIDMAAATPSDQINPGSGSDGSEAMHTTHFSVVDAMGGAVALTTTINHGNGSAVTVDGAGFLLNNEMDDFASKPGSANAFGLVQGEANAIAPGKRMLSAMTPTIVVRDGVPVLVTGASGGPTIITGVLQVMLNTLDYGLDVSTAVSLPRIHQQHLPDMILFEAGGFSEADLEALRQRGHELMPGRFNIAVAASLRRTAEGWSGTRDPRVLGLARGQ
jgi:gamma-glutamyltranspeptidase/glutathione hydrolase